MLFLSTSYRSQERTLAPVLFGAVPLTERDLALVANAYHAWVRARLAAMVREINRLSSALAIGSFDQVQAGWLAAHLIYEGLGAAYEVFGQSDSALNALFRATPDSASGDTSVSGFHKVEALVWTGAPVVDVKEAVAELRAAAARLQQMFVGVDVSPAAMARRMPEIIGTAIAVELTGESDAGSHTGLATIAANLFGVAKVLAVLEPVLQVPYPSLHQAQAALAESEVLIYKLGANASWRRVQDLGARGRGEIRDSLERTSQALGVVSDSAVAP